MGTSLFSSTTNLVSRAALLDQLDRACRAGSNGQASAAAMPSGFSELDTQLPGGGWPVGALTECLLDGHGIGELRLWIPALRAMAQAKRYLAFVTPPFMPYAPALVQHGISLEQVIMIACGSGDESLWVAEQALRCAAFGAVLVWPKAITDKQLRRLQLAAEAGKNLGILYRPLSAAHSASPAALRIKLCADKTGLANSLQIDIHKCRGGRSGVTVRCMLNQASSITHSAA